MNNATRNCPPQMSDGRLFTDYRPSGDVYDACIKKALKNGIENNYQFRQYMIDNSNRILSETHNHLLSSRLCKKCTLENNINNFE